MTFSKVAPSVCYLQKKKSRQEEAHHTWHMKDGITLWKVDPLYPKPFSPVHRALKFSGWGWVGGEGKKQVSTKVRIQMPFHSSPVDWPNDKAPLSILHRQAPALLSCAEEQDKKT